MLKSVQYYYGGDRRKRGTVVYAIEKDGQCVFVSLTKSPSSNQAAADIIRAICAAEHFHPTSMQFFDLQTHRGYAKLRPGEHDLQGISLQCIGDKISVTGREPYWCSVETADLFQAYIGEAVQLVPSTVYYGPFSLN